jgi:hypothetical protein
LRVQGDIHHFGLIETIAAIAAAVIIGGFAKILEDAFSEAIIGVAIIDQILKVLKQQRLPLRRCLIELDQLFLLNNIGGALSKGQWGGSAYPAARTGCSKEASKIRGLV